MEKIVERLKSEAGLQWPIKIGTSIGTCKCASDALSKEHSLWIDSETKSDTKRAEYNLAHEMCHFLLAEKIDPLFSCTLLSRDHATNTSFHKRIFMAKAHEDMWVNKLRHKLWPKTTKSEFEDNTADLLILGRKYPSFFNELTSQLMLAMVLATQRIHEFAGDLRPVTRKLDVKTLERVNRLRDLCCGIPEVPSEKELALTFLENSVKTFWGIYGFPDPKPIIVEEEGHSVFTVLH